MIDHKNLAVFRKQQHLSQEQVARRLNMTQSAYGKIERGKTRLPADLVVKLAQIFKVDPKNIIGDKNQDNIPNNFPASEKAHFALQRKILSIFIEKIESIVDSKYSAIMVNYDGVPLEYEDLEDFMMESFKTHYNIYSAEDYHSSDRCPVPYINTQEEEFDGFKKLMEDPEIYYIFKLGLLDFRADPAYSRCWEKYQSEDQRCSRPATLPICPDVIMDFIRSIKQE